MHKVAPLLFVLAFGASAQNQDAYDPNLLWSQATLYRDEWGVPHVYAETPRALAFAFGYAQAEDHLEAMLLSYRVANGRAAAVLGEAYADAWSEWSQSDEADAWDVAVGDGLAPG